MSDLKLTRLERAVWELAWRKPGITSAVVAEEGLVETSTGTPAARTSIKRALAGLRKKELLWPSRPTTVAVKAHRVPPDLEDPGDRLYAMLKLAQEIGPCPQSTFLHHPKLEHIPPTMRPLLLTRLRDLGLIHPWNALLPKGDKTPWDEDPAARNN